MILRDAWSGALSRCTTLVAAALLLVSSAAQAVTYIVPADREMIQRSDDIVIATGVTSTVERTAAGGIVTRFTLRLEEVLKGHHAAGDYLVLTERGGRLGDRLQYLPGTPVYEPGQRYLVFTETNRVGEPVTFGMGLGQFFLTSDKGRALALRGNVEGFNPNFDPHVERARDREGFLEYVRGIVAQRIHPEPRYFVPNAVARWEPRSEWNIAAEATRASYLLTDNGRPLRWLTPSATIVKATPPDTPPSPDGDAAVALALSQWNGTDSNIDYSDGGADDTATAGFIAPDGKDTILFNDPNGEVTNAAGLGGITDAGSQYTLDGETFWRVLEVDVVMNQTTVAQSCYNTVMVHEVGHTLGFRHSNQNGTSQPTCSAPAVCSSVAIMNSAVACSWNGVLKPWDLEAAHTVYGSDPVCGSPGITAQPANKTIIPPDTATSLRVTASGTEPLTYRWFVGDSGDTSRTIGTNSKTLQVSPAATTNYWVRVTGPCEPAVYSNTVTVTVLLPNGRRRAVRK
jgi:hypothetical protein